MQSLLALLPFLAQAAANTAEASAYHPTSLGRTFALGLAGLGGALGVGMVGAKAAEATGRNPGAAGQILTISIIGMALAEAIAIYAFIAFFLAA